ncbi:MAG: N,N-dimethylformamidase large subunit [Marinovum sp.]|nr:N,N-dimethylformamidase large subunit [Marinovum sp.]
MQTVSLVGYSDKLSARPGDKIDFMVSSQSDAPYEARLFRSISADPNPAGAGLVEHRCERFFPDQKFPSRRQSFHPGSHLLTVAPLVLDAQRAVTLSLMLYPTLQTPATQTLLSFGKFALELNPQGGVTLRAGAAAISTPEAAALRQWARVQATVETSGRMTILLEDVSVLSTQTQAQTQAHSEGHGAVDLIQKEVVLIAAAPGPTAPGPTGPVGAVSCFNGKIEAPQITADGRVIAAWDFAHNISGMTVPAQTGPDFILVNAPTRAVTGALWDASEMNWRHRPEHYAAIAFHQDEIYDFNWEADFSFVIPSDLPCGAYVMRISCGDAYDAMPFFVCPELGKPRAKLCVLVSTFTYVIYGNHARPDYEPSWLERIKDWGAYPNNPAVFSDYGLSTYNNHRDGSGICHASHRRPLFNMRPGYLTFGQAECSGLRHFQADSHLISWLHAKGLEYDIVTDEELHNDGVAAVQGYAALVTGSHPEYHTAETLDALTAYRDQGGALHYLGGNGFYWRIARHNEDPALLEIRRAEDGLRAWASEPGEYYNAFDGAYGGLWRRSGRAPQKLVGVGFTAQGVFTGMPYHRVCYDPNFDWVFEGIETDVIGDFGFSGNGAAGFELDRTDTMLDSGHDITILAQSHDTENEFMLVPEEQLTHLTNLSGGPEDAVRRADMVYFETEGGGRVFSVGSITFCGSLPWNNFDNTVSRLLLNVLSHSLDAP